MNNSISVKCRRCGKSAQSSEFVLDPVYKLMVCPDCVKERKNRELQKKAAVEEQPKIKIMKERAPGWDPEDDYLEQYHRQKKASIIQSAQSMQQIGNKINYKCYNCKYFFIYNKEKKYPNLCPNCGAAIFIARKRV